MNPSFLVLIFLTFASLSNAQRVQSGALASSWNKETNSRDISLARKKRFLFPATSPWTFDIALTLFVPLDGTPIYGNPLVAFLPFSFNLNTMT